MTSVVPRTCAIAIVAGLVIPSHGGLAGEAISDEIGTQTSMIDVHAHLVRNARSQLGPAVANMLKSMAALHVQTTIVMSPPAPEAFRGTRLNDLARIAREKHGTIAFLGGGDSLNPLLQSAAPNEITAELKRRFESTAEEILRAGAVGFGEFAALHLSSGRGRHPYEAVAPDHPLFLLLADIAARHDVPIDLHMEAVVDDMPTPVRMDHAPNPPTLRGDIVAFERLLAHNAGARIVWSHAGWDNTGERSVSLMRRLLGAHPNLYMSIKLDPGPRPNRPLDQNGVLRPEWLALVRDFPDRFMIGSDQFYDSDLERISLAEDFSRQLPADLRRKITLENALRVYKIAATR